METTLASRDKSTIGFTLSFCLLLVSTRRPQRQTRGQTAAHTSAKAALTASLHGPASPSLTTHGRGAALDGSAPPGDSFVKALMRHITKDLDDSFLGGDRKKRFATP